MGKLDYGAILCDDGVHKMQAARNPPQVLEDSTGHEYDDDVLRPQLGYGLTHLRVQHIVPGDGAIEVESKH